MFTVWQNVHNIAENDLRNESADSGNILCINILKNNQRNIATWQIII